jgi:hypothetical protein
MSTNQHDPLEDAEPDEEQVKRAVSKGIYAFWEAVVQVFPDIMTGDLDPLAAVVFKLSCEKVVREWLHANS